MATPSSLFIICKFSNNFTNHQVIAAEKCWLREKLCIVCYKVRKKEKTQMKVGRLVQIPLLRKETLYLVVKPWKLRYKKFKGETTNKWLCNERCTWQFHLCLWCFVFVFQSIKKKKTPDFRVIPTSAGGTPLRILSECKVTNCERILFT